MRLWSIPVMLVFWLLLVASMALLREWAFPPRPPGDGIALVRHPLFLTWTALLLAAQGVLLIRIRPARDRPKARRKVRPALIATAFCLGLLSIGLVVSLSMAGTGDQAMEGLGASANFVARAFPGHNADAWFIGIVFFGFIGGMWAVWWMLIGKATKETAPESLPARLLTWILAGSVLELLVAVPCHILCRRREECCAPVLTFWGMAMGWALLLLSLGPAVGLLVERRIARKKARPMPPGRPDQTAA
ncbi:MAG: hypothetical protein KGS60_09980 [Verrucomicrobia bacterium]|nr:hypothetical protein [Verrucomicrobiota bacterium]